MPVIRSLFALNLTAPWLLVFLYTLPNFLLAPCSMCSMKPVTTLSASKAPNDSNPDITRLLRSPDVVHRARFQPSEPLTQKLLTAVIRGQFANLKRTKQSLLAEPNVHAATSLNLQSSLACSSAMSLGCLIGKDGSPASRGCTLLPTRVAAARHRTINIF